MPKPCTYTRFLECLDNACYQRGTPTRATTNTRTFLMLADSIMPGRPVPLESGTCQIYGIPLWLDERVPDHAIAFDGVLYNEKENAPYAHG